MDSKVVPEADTTPPLVMNIDSPVEAAADQIRGEMGPIDLSTEDVRGTVKRFFEGNPNFLERRKLESPMGVKFRITNKT